MKTSSLRVNDDVGRDYDAVIFAGGGCRCVWQLGFWEVVSVGLRGTPEVVGAVSAGAAMACLIFAGRVDAGLASFKRRAAANRWNAYPLNLLRGAPVFPHERIYRDTLLESLDGVALARLHAGPDIRVLLARPPHWFGARLSVLAGFVAYHGEMLLGQSVHTRLGRHTGFAPEVVSVRSCRSGEEVADLILHSSCTPPLTPVYQRDGRPVLDGGLVDCVPVEAAAAPGSATLVLLTAQHPPARLPRVDGRTYVQPSAPIRIARWDYTSPAGVQEAYDLGRRDGERFVRS